MFVEGATRDQKRVACVVIQTQPVRGIITRLISKGSNAE